MPDRGPVGRAQCGPEPQEAEHDDPGPEEGGGSIAAVQSERDKGHARDVGDGDLGHELGNRRSVQVGLPEAGNNDGSRRRRKQKCVQPGVLTTGQRGNREGGREGQQCDAARPQAPAPQPESQGGVPKGHVGAGHEHHQCEPDLGEEVQGRVGRGDEPQHGRAEQDPHAELTQDRRDPRPGQVGEQRPTERRDADDRQHRE